MPFITGNVGTWANHFLRPEHLPPTTRLGHPAHRLHRGLFARAQNAFSQHNPHSLYWLAQQPPVLVMVCPWVLFQPLSTLDTAIAEVLFGVSRPVETFFRVGHFLLRHAWGLTFTAASLAIDILAMFCIAFAESVQVVCLTNGVFALSSAALTFIGAAIFYGIASSAGAAHDPQFDMLGDGTFDYDLCSPLPPTVSENEANLGWCYPRGLSTTNTVYRVLGWDWQGSGQSFWSR